MSLNTGKSSQVPDYDSYVYSRTELIKYLVIVIILISVLSILCYDNILFAILLSPYIPYYLHVKRKKLMEEQRWTLNIQFCEGINCVSSALESGYSIENAISEAYSDMKLTYAEDALIMREFRNIIHMLDNNLTVEEAFIGLADRSGLEDIKSFADIFGTAKRTGGNIMAIIKSTADIIHTRVELKRELKTVIASKKYEADIMKLIPFAMLIYLRVFSPDMVSALYGNAFGACFMTVVLVVYLILCKISDFVVKIEM